MEIAFLLCSISFATGSSGRVTWSHKYTDVNREKLTSIKRWKERAMLWNSSGSISTLVFRLKLWHYRNEVVVNHCHNHLTKQYQQRIMTKEKIIRHLYYLRLGILKWYVTVFIVKSSTRHIITEGLKTLRWRPVKN